MADFDIEPESLCHDCQNINWEQVASPGGYRLHHSLVDLDNCGKTCGLCRDAFQQVERDFVAEERDLSSDDIRTFLSSKDAYHTLMQHFITIVEAQSTNLQMGRRGSLYLTVLNSDSQVLASSSQPTHVGVPRYWMQAWSLQHEYFGFEPLNASPTFSCIPRILKLPKNTGSQLSADKAQTWLKECAEGIGSHKWPLATTHKELPNRLIRISGEEGCYELSIVDGSSCQGSYAALSYCWGDGPAPWKTLRFNINERFISLPVAGLPLTLLQAVEVTWRLGLRYLWIDSICIVQDDLQDWEAEAINMTNVFKHAAITIAADWGIGADAGLYNSQSRSNAADLYSQKYSVPYLNGQSHLLLAYSTGSSQVGGSISHSSLAGRGWSYQENVLSPRVLHFTKSQLYWECAHSFQSEDGFVDIPQPFDNFKGALQRWAQDITVSEHDVIGLWHAAIQNQYSKRKLSKQADRLLAVAGIAQLARSICPMQYHAGHWDHMIVRSLCWRPNDDQGKALVYCAPSWSWASQVGVVSWETAMFSRMSDVREHAAVLDVNITTKSGDAFGLVTGASIALQTYAIGGRIRERRDDKRGIDVWIRFGAIQTWQGSEEDDSLSMYCWLDSPGQMDIQNIEVCLMTEHPGSSQNPSLWFLLLSETQCGSGLYIRVGCKSLFRPEYQIHKLRTTFLKAPKRTFVVV